MELQPLYREIDELLEARARRPVRETATDRTLDAKLERLSRALLSRAESCGEPLGLGVVESWCPRLQESAVFIVGYRRTGKSTLRSLLYGHPAFGAVLHVESKHFKRFLPAYGHLERSAQVRVLHGRWLQRLVAPRAHPPFWILGRPWEAPSDPYELFTLYLCWLARRYEDRDLLGLLATALAAVRLEQGRLTAEPRLWVEEMSQLEGMVGEIAGVYPLAKFIHAVRDPRGTVADLIKEGLRQDAWHLSGSVRRSLAAALRNRRRLGRERYFVVRYEDLVRETRSTMEALARFLEIEFADCLLIPAAAGGAAGQASSESTRESAQEIHTLSLEPWRGYLDARSLAILQARTGRVARRLGYPRRQSRARTSWTLAAERAARLARRLRRAALRSSESRDQPVADQRARRLR